MTANERWTDDDWRALSASLDEMYENSCPGLVRAIRAVEAGAAPDDVIPDVVGTSAKCALALIYDRPAMLPPPYVTQATAWQRLDVLQQSIVGRHVPLLADHLRGRSQS